MQIAKTEGVTIYLSNYERDQLINIFVSLRDPDLRRNNTFNNFELLLIGSKD